MPGTWGAVLVLEYLNKKPGNLLAQSFLCSRAAHTARQWHTRHMQTMMSAGLSQENGAKYGRFLSKCVMTQRNVPLKKNASIYFWLSLEVWSPLEGIQDWHSSTEVKVVMQMDTYKQKYQKLKKIY